MSFWSMGGYASFIWPAYGVSVLGIGGAIAWTLKTYAGARARLAALEKESRLKKLEEKKP